MMLAVVLTPALLPAQDKPADKTSTTKTKKAKKAKKKSLDDHPGSEGGKETKGQ
jgi:hypothetical protein